MAVKLRLTRKGRKKRPFYHIVASDERAPRDGRFIEKLGTYDPTTNPASINVDVDRSVSWLQNGAIPTDTVRAILSYKGVMYKNHLLKGAAKGAFPLESVEDKFNEWLTQKEANIQKKIDGLADVVAKKSQEEFERESKLRQAKAAAVLAKTSELAGEVAEETEAVVEEVAEAAEEVVAVAEEVVEEVAEAVAEVAEVVEEAAPEAEAKAEEAPAEETPAEDAEKTEE